MNTSNKDILLVPDTTWGTGSIVAAPERRCDEKTLVRRNLPNFLVLNYDQWTTQQLVNAYND